MARHPPRILGFVSVVTLRHLPVPKGDRRDPSRRPSDTRPKSCGARARHTGPNTTFVKLLGCSRPVAAARASQPASGGVARPVFEPEARCIAPGELGERRGRRDAQGDVGGFRGKTVLVTFAKTKVTRGYGGGAPRAF